MQKNQINIEDYYNSENISYELIDVRSPSEYFIDHIPGAINYPALNDLERANVGKLYNENPFEAKKMGAALICKNIAIFLENGWKNKPRSWQPVIYCWRGGNRSRSVSHVLEKIGWKVLILNGGYKAYRKYVLNSISEFVNCLSFSVVCGLTGSGKTKFLSYLGSKNEQVLDLEDLARHRGSLLGGIPSIKQPSQKMFDSLLLNKLKSFETDRKIFVESESKKIGNIQLPESLIKLMRQSDCLWIETSDFERVKLLREEYIHLANDTNELKKIIEKLIQINNLNKNLYIKNLNDPEDLDKLVLDLLIKHYDPAYKKSMKNNFAKLSWARVIYMKDAKPINYSEVLEEAKRSK